MSNIEITSMNTPRPIDSISSNVGFDETVTIGAIIEPTAIIM